MKHNSNPALGIFASPGLIRRAPKATPATQGINQPDPYATCMACWVSFMQVDDRDLGSRGMKLAGSGEVERDVHTEQYLADLKIGEAVNAMVESLSIRDRWAIYRSQGISKGWRFENADYAAVLSEARDELEKKLRKNIATRIYFL